MLNKLIVYEKALYADTFPRMFSDAKEIGFDGFEINVDESDYRLARLKWTDKKCREIINQAFDAGIDLHSLTFSGQKKFPLGSADTEVIKLSKKMMIECIQLSAKLGVRCMQVAGCGRFYEPETSETTKRFTENMVEMVKYAEQYGVIMAIEPLEHGLTDCDQCLKVVKAANSPFLQLYPDIANMAGLGIDYLEQIEKSIGHIAQIHVREALPNNFGGIKIGTGIIDWVGTFKKIMSLNITVPITYEFWNQNNRGYKPELQAAFRYLKNAMNQAERG